jgi:hypothetical protein
MRVKLIYDKRNVEMWKRHPVLAKIVIPSLPLAFSSIGN